MKSLFISISVLSICFLLLSLPDAHMYEKVPFMSSANPVGSGARAMGMGGAFISIADDATATSWNPSGLVQLDRKESSFVHVLGHRIERDRFLIQPLTSARQSVNFSDLNYLSYVNPFTWNDQIMAVAVTFQNLYNFDRELNIPVLSDYPMTFQEKQYEIEQSGNFYVLGIAYALKVSPSFYMGLTFNLWDNNYCSWDSIERQKGKIFYRPNNVIYYTNSLTRNHYEIQGINFNLGLMYRVNKKIILGAVLKTPFKGDFNWRKESLVNQPDLVEKTNFTNVSPNIYNGVEKIKMPMSYGIGISYKYSERFSIALDIYHTEWHKFMRELSSGDRLSALTGGYDFIQIKDTTQIRIGFEYLKHYTSQTIPVCMGLFYDPAPAANHVDDYYGFSIGSGIQIFERYHFDLAYQFRFANSINYYQFENKHGERDVREHQVYSSVVVHF
jgi:long-subunit fatty acid transport protein